MTNLTPPEMTEDLYAQILAQARTALENFLLQVPELSGACIVLNPGSWSSAQFPPGITLYRSAFGITEDPNISVLTAMRAHLGLLATADSFMLVRLLREADAEAARIAAEIRKNVDQLKQFRRGVDDATRASAAAAGSGTAPDSGAPADPPPAAPE